jgi:hypothetical protein
VFMAKNPAGCQKPVDMAWVRVLESLSVTSLQFAEKLEVGGNSIPASNLERSAPQTADPVSVAATGLRWAAGECIVWKECKP